MATVAVAHDQVPARGASRGLAPAVIRATLAVSFVATLAVGIQSARFGMQTPSLVDDWFGVNYSGAAFHALLHGDYASSAVDFAGRYRPAYTALWNYAQWHLPGGPSIATAAAWGVIRVALFVVGVWLLATCLMRQTGTGGRWLAWMAPLAVVMTPATAVDLVRYGPGEPMMVAGLVIGLYLLAIGARAVVFDVSERRGRAYALIAGGYAVYLIGVYSKEASVVLLIFAPFFRKWLAPWIAPDRLSSRSRVLLAALAALVVAPLLHVATHLAAAVFAGDRPYPHVDMSLSTKLFAAIVSPLLGAPGTLGTWFWFFAAASAVWITIALARRRDRDAWLVGGILATGFLMGSVELARATPSRYYIPWLVAVAAVVFRTLAQARLVVQLTVVLSIIGMTFWGTPAAIAEWVRTEHSASTAVRIAKSVVGAGCPLYLAHFDVEQAIAIPQLFRFASAKPVEGCARGSREAYAMSWELKPLPMTFGARCRSGWHRVGSEDRVALLRCASFRSEGIPNQFAGSGEQSLTVVRLQPTLRAPKPAALFQRSVPNDA